MIALRATGLAYQVIADTLNAEGVKPRQGAKWHGGVVSEILRAQAK